MPAKINRGIASRVNESIPDIYFCGRKIKKSGDITKIAANEANPRDIAIGTERTNKTAKTRPKTIPGSKLFLLKLFYFCFFLKNNLCNKSVTSNIALVHRPQS